MHRFAPAKGATIILLASGSMAALAGHPAVARCSTSPSWLSHPTDRHQRHDPLCSRRRHDRARDRLSLGVNAINRNPKPLPAFLFDLDGTLVDSVYQHVLAWREALERAGISLSVWRIHRRIGMSGGLFVNALLRETGQPVTREQTDRLRQFHAEEYARLVGQVRPLPGARELLEFFTGTGVPWSIATSGWLESAQPALDMLGVGPDIPVITRDQVRHAKPDPDLFLAAARGLNVSIETSIVVGDSVWDLLAARRARALGVGLLSGGYGDDELIRAGAYRVYEDPADLLRRLDELGVRLAE